MDPLFTLLGTVLAAGLGALAGWLAGQARARRAASAAEQEAAVQRERATQAQAREAEALGREEQREERARAQAEALARTQSELRHAQERLLETRSAQEEALRTLRAEIQGDAQRTLEAKTKSFQEQGERSLGMLLQPLQQKIAAFEKRVEESYGNEAKERFALKSEVGRLIELNDRMRTETQSLTQALKGDAKFQGDWGELVLERILESSGLRKDHEYTLQESALGADGDRYRPDVLVKLPDDKHIVVDSKVSLKAYELYTRAGSEAERAAALQAHLKSIRDHIDDLSEKSYARLQGVRSPDFVCLFMPIEPAYLVAMQADPELAARAWRKHVAIVTATTLFTTLKTIASIWRVERQNQNAQLIAEEGGRLYDKFAGFTEDFLKLGKIQDQGQRQFQDALTKLQGRGGISSKVERLRELGAASTKQLPADLTES